MRRQSVIMLLGLMSTLSLPAFAIAGSRESSHATQPYKYIGKELDRTHGLDWLHKGGVTTREDFLVNNKGSSVKCVDACRVERIALT